MTSTKENHWNILTSQMALLSKDYKFSKIGRYAELIAHT